MRMDRRTTVALQYLESLSLTDPRLHLRVVCGVGESKSAATPSDLVEEKN
jgi:hypothetical protein